MIEATRNQLPSHLYEARDQARLCLGDAFDMQMFEGGVLLTRIAADRRETVLSVAVRMARRSYEQDRNFGAIAILAAAVELIEPSGLPS